MARYQVEGQSGAVRILVVPGPGLDQRTFDGRVERGEWKIIRRLDVPDRPAPSVPDVTLPEVAVSRPPEAGPGSSRKAWAEFASANGVEVSDDDTRDDIIAKVNG